MSAVAARPSKGNATTLPRLVNVHEHARAHYGRNLNTGKSDNKTSETAVAHQTILHNLQQPSYTTLPIAPDVAIPPTATASTRK